MQLDIFLYVQQWEIKLWYDGEVILREFRYLKTEIFFNNNPQNFANRQIEYFANLTSSNI
jgi:hypothetical protein